MLNPEIYQIFTRGHLEIIVAEALSHGISGAQIRTWVDEFLINEIDHYPQETKGITS